jgi:hypothetical protein
MNIECDFKSDSWRAVGKIKNCFVRNMKVRKLNQTIKSVNGNTTVFPRVNGIWIESEVCHFLPEGWANFFPNILAFGLSGSKLQRLSKLDLKPFPDMIRFASYQSEMEFLEADVFVHNQNLESITLTDNNLMVIDSSVLDILPNLNYAHFGIKCCKAMCEAKDCRTMFNEVFKANCQAK